MKKILCIILIYMVLLPTIAIAQTTSPSEESTTNLTDQINNLKDRIASRVAQLNLVENRGIIATVTEVTGTRITVSDINQETRFIDVDEITKFSSPSAKATFGISDLTPGTKISILGLYNKDSRRILARFIDTYTIPLFVTGHVQQVDRTNFTFTVLSEKNVSTLVDVENITRTSTYTEEDEITRAGFSSVNIGQRVSVFGFQNTTEKDRMTASRVLIFQDVAKNPNIDDAATERSVSTPSPTRRATQTP